MRIFLTGATGYTGAVVLDHLLETGYEVSALARAHHLPTLPVRRGVEWIAGDFAQPEVIFDAARAADATVHIGASHDVENAEMERLDGLTIRAIADALAGTGKIFVNTSATPVYGDTGARPRDESEPVMHPLAVREWRLQHDRETVAMTERGIRSVVLRPPMIYGRGKGVLAKQIARARASGKARYTGEGTRLSSTVHVDAFAALYLKALRNERAQGVYNAASDEVVRAADIAHVIAERFGPGVVAGILGRSRRAQGPGRDGRDLGDRLRGELRQGASRAWMVADRRQCDDRTGGGLVSPARRLSGRQTSLRPGHPMTPDLDELAADLARLNDERAVERLIYAYGHALDFGTPADYAALFIEDAVVEIHSALIHVLKLDIPFPAQTAALLTSRGAEATPDGMAFRGHAALRRFVTRPGARTARSLHVSSQPLVTLLGADAAEAVTYLRIYQHESDDTPRLTAFGRYLDTFRRTPDGWRIARRICQL